MKRIAVTLVEAVGGLLFLTVDATVREMSATRYSTYI